MKKNTIKKLMGLTLAASLILAGCSSSPSEESTENNQEAKSITIGINQLAEHPALDQVRQGFEKGLKESGIEATITYQNAQGDLQNSNSIASKFVSDKVDLMLGIGTGAAQSLKNATSDIPVLFSAVTDPVDAGLVDSIESPGANVTGTSDKTPMKEQLSLFNQIDPNIKKVGIIYSTSEPNSLTQVEEAKEVAKELGLEIVELGINNINEVPQAVDSILSKADAIYTITDNTVASAMSAVSSKATEQGKIIIGAEQAHVEAGALMTDGLSYFELGKQTGKMAAEILNGKSPSEVPVQFLENLTKAVNKTTAEKLNIDINSPLFEGATII